MNLNFSAETKVAFSDYMYDYLTNVEGRKGFVYNTSKSFAEKEKLVNKAVLAEIVKLSNVPLNIEGIDPVQMAQHPNTVWAAIAVTGSLIDSILPEVVDKGIGLYTETRFGTLGENFRFDVESNDLFHVGVAGRNQRTVDFQRQWAGTHYIAPINHEISVQANLFRTLCGLDSLARLVMKAILSIEANITKEVFNVLDTAMGALPTTADAQFRVTAAGGVVDKVETLKLTQLVGAYNGGVSPILVGTKVALSHVFPASDSGFRYEDANIAYYKNVWGLDTLELRQIADYQNKYQLSLNDNRIYVISPSVDKMVKLCYEGGTTSNTIQAMQTANKTESTTLEKSWGIGLITNAVAGVIELP